jgi:hypothetical protein
MIVRTENFVAAIVLLVSASSMACAQVVKVDPPVRISPAGSGGHSWGMGNTYAAPDDPKSLITCGIRMQSNPLAWEGYLYTSADGGLTWQVGRIDSTPTDDGVPDQVSETACAIGRHGTMYMNTSVYGKWHSQAFQLAHSTDAGHTWSKPTQRRGWFDATRSVVDNSGGPLDGRLYIFSNRLFGGPDPKVNPCYPCYEPLLTSIDGGRSLSAAVAEKPGAQYAGPGTPSQAIVLNDGKAMAVHTVFFAASTSGGSDAGVGNNTGKAVEHWGIDVVTSSDGGRSLDQPMTIGRWERDRHVGVTRWIEPPGMFDESPTLAVDRSKGEFGGRVYVAWRQAERADSVGQIMLTWSGDSGRTWSKPVRVDDAVNRGSEALLSAIAVNKDGTVGLLWMEHWSKPSWHFAASLDGGVTFGPSSRVYSSLYDNVSCGEPSCTDWLNYFLSAQDHPNGPRSQSRPGLNADLKKAGFALYTQFDETAALTASTDGVFHAVWITRADGVLWTSRVTVDRASSAATAAAHSSLDVTGMKDISDRVRLEARNFHYDRYSGLLQVDVVMANTSLGVADRQPFIEASPKGWRSKSPGAEALGRPLSGPLILRVPSVESEAGRLELVNADGRDASGAPLLDWSDALPAAGLPPGARSPARRMEFRLSDLKAYVDPSMVQVVNVTAEVFTR